jgi:hypothetical protein
MRRTLLTLTLAVMALVLVPGTASAAPPGGPEARGHGTTTGVWEQFNFSARGTPVDADGSIRVTDHDTNTTVEGEVDCLNVIGNDAYLSGAERHTEPGSLQLRFYAHAEDNGGPGGGKNSVDPPDRFDVFVTGTLIFFHCSVPGFIEGLPLLRGDVRVDAGQLIE